MILDIGQEKVDENLKEEIRSHDHGKLRHTDIVEKNALPQPIGKQKYDMISYHYCTTIQ